MSPAFRRIAFVAGLPLASALLLFGCAQGEGDRCEVNSDCKSGLTCERPTLADGICRTPNRVVPIVDASTSVDGAVTDAGAGLSDAQTTDVATDTASTQEAGADAATIDGPIDAAVGDGAGVDRAGDTAEAG
jgi:hypothetical protein